MRSCQEIPTWILPAMELNMPTTSAMVVVNIVLRVYVYYAEDT